MARKIKVKRYNPYSGEYDSYNVLPKEYRKAKKSKYGNFFSLVK